MKNIITIVLILILPVLIYVLITRNSNELSAFAKDKSMPTLMSFTSTMCIDCQKLKRNLNEIEGLYQNKINFVTLNATEKSKKVQQLVKKHGIVLVPTMVFLDIEGNEMNKIEGYVEKEDIKKELEELLNG